MPQKPKPEGTAEPRIALTKGRLEAFSDGVIAIIITIMVLELKTPHGHELSDLMALLPVFLGYVLSFIYVGIYWNNHHHMFHAVHKINGGVLWANLHLLFWMSLIPFATAWLWEEHLATWPAVVYGAVLLMNGVAYSILVQLLIRCNGSQSLLARAIGSDVKGLASVVIYIIGIGLSFVSPLLGVGCYAVTALIWLIPDRRFEKHYQSGDEITHEPH
jgi:uncharacterized membrane protein